MRCDRGRPGRDQDRGHRPGRRRARSRRRRRVPTPARRLRRPRSTAIAAPGRASWSATPAARGTVGVGMPGTISPATGLVKNANSVWLNGRPLAEDLERAPGPPAALRQRRQLLRAVRGQRTAPAAGARVVFGVIVGTGTGGGVVVDGRVLDGPNAIAGEWGHNPLPWPRAEEWPGPPCYCGRTRLHRDVPLRARAWPGTTAQATGEARTRPPSRRAAAARRRGRRGDARPLRGPDGAGAGRGHQRRWTRT